MSSFISRRVALFFFCVKLVPLIWRISDYYFIAQVALVVCAILIGLSLKTTVNAAAVANLAAVGVGTGSAVINWDNQGGSVYNVSVTSVPFNVALSSPWYNSPADQNTTTFIYLQPNTSYHVNVKVEPEVDANIRFVSFVTTSAAPGFKGFQVYTTSIVVFSARNIEPDGSTATYVLKASTDAFTSTVFQASGAITGFADVREPTVTINAGLIPNTSYYLRTHLELYQSDSQHGRMSPLYLPALPRRFPPRFI